MKTRKQLLGRICFAAVVSWACGGGRPSPPHGPSAPQPSAAEAAGQRFVSDPVGTGSAVFVQAQFITDGQVQLTVTGRGLGEVFGYAIRLSFDSAAVSPRLAEHGPFEQLLGADKEGVAAYTLRLTAEKLSLGGTRYGKAAGPVMFASEVPMATVVLKPLRAGESRINFDFASVRRADGTSHPPHAFGGLLTIPENTR